MPSQSMRDDLQGLFATPAEVFIKHVLRKKEPTRDEEKLVELYVERHREMLAEAKHFVVDADAYDMLRKLLNEIKKEELSDTFQYAKFPFPIVLIEGGVGLKAAAMCLIGETDKGFYSECFVKFPLGVAPNAKVFMWEGTDVDVLGYEVGEYDGQTRMQAISKFALAAFTGATGVVELNEAAHQAGFGIKEDGENYASKRAFE